MGAIGLAVVGCLVGIFGGQKRVNISPPPIDPPGSTPPTGPSAWAWLPRTEQESTLLATDDDGVPTTLITNGCAANDRLYFHVSDSQCTLRSQSLVALMSQTEFSSAPRRHDGSDLSALLAPSRIAGESAEMANSWRSQALQRVRSTTFVKEGDASWCNFTVERNTLRASCSLDRLGLYSNSPPRTERAQSCAMHAVPSCGSCESNDDCRDSSDCGCAQSRCVRGQCSRCSDERTCSEPTFTVRAQPWVVTTPVTAENQAVAHALQSRPSAFRTVLHFAVLNANRDVRPARGGMVEYDSGYRIGIRPLSMSVLLCSGNCRQHFRSELLMFSAPMWDTSHQSLRFHCVRGVCSATAESLE